MYSAQTGTCYYFSDASGVQDPLVTSYNDAYKACAEKGGYLLKLDTEEEFEMIKQYVEDG